MKTGVLYQEGLKGKRVVEVGRVVGTLKRMAWGLRWAGAGIMMAGIAGIVWIWGPLAAANLKYQVPRNKQIPMTNIQIPNWEIPDTNYSIYIPKIGAISKVVPDVDADNKKEYLEALKLGVAEASGLAHPGETGTTFLFAHSAASPLDYARYNAVFYLLDRLVLGDEIELVYRGKLFKYEVTSVQRLASSDTKYLRLQEDEELLVLQTCWPPGTNWKRLVVIARKLP